MLELSDRTYNTTPINTLRDLMDKVHSIEEYMGELNREMEILRKNQTEILSF